MKGLPHPDFGEGVTAVVVAKAGSDISAAGIAKALDEYLYQQHWEKEDPEQLPGEPLPFMEEKKEHRQIGELCPECGQATLINEEGCRKCYTCGHSEC